MAGDPVVVKFGAETGDIKRGASEAAQAIQSSSSTITDALRNMESATANSVNKMVGSLSGSGGVKGSLVDIQREMSVTEVAAGKLGTAIAAAFSAAAAKSIFDTGSKIEGLQIAFTSIFGTLAAGQNEFKFVRAEAERLGVSFIDLAKSYQNIGAAAQNTTLAGEGIRRIFSAVAEAGAVQRKSIDDINGALLALSQVISKGKVQAEELRGQLGERLPGAMQILAQSLGKTTSELDKMMERGELTISVLLDLAKGLHERNAGSVGEASNSAQGALAKLGNAWEDLKKSLYDTAIILGLVKVFQALTETVKIAQTAVDMFTTSLKMNMSYVKATIDIIGQLSSGGYGDALGKFFGSVYEAGKADVFDSGKFKEAVGQIGSALTDLKTITTGKLESINQTWSNAGKEFDKIYSDYQQRLKERRFGPDVAPATGGMQGPPEPDSVKNPDKYLQDMKKRLKDQEAWYTVDLGLKNWSARNEAEYWSSILDSVAKGSETEKRIKQELSDSLQKVERLDEAERKKSASAAKRAASEASKEAREQYQNDIAEMRTQLENYRDNAEERVRIAKRMADRTAQAYGKDSKEYQQMCRLIIQEERRYQQQMDQLHEVDMQRKQDSAEAGIELAQEEIRTKRELGVISGIQELQMLIQLENQKHQIEWQALMDRMKMRDMDVIDQAKTYREIEQLQLKHNIKVKQMENQQRIQSQNSWRQLGSTITQSFGNAIKGVINGTMTAGQAMQSILGSVLDFLIDKMLEWVAQWIIGLFTTKTAATGAGMASAAEGAAAAGASVAHIPFWGWAAAPGVAAETYAILSAYAMMGMASAAGGWEVPSDTIAQVHAGEKILPADKSRAIDDMIASYGHMKGGGQAVINNHYTIQAMDGRDVERVLKKHGNALAKGIQTAKRDLRFSGSGRLAGVPA